MTKARLQQAGDDVLIWIKAVPNASRDQVAGAIGERLKIRVAAPPEDGKANKAICAVLAKTLGVRPKQVTVESGHTGVEKTVRVAGITVTQVAARLL